MVAHYVDDYTQNDEWVMSAGMVENSKIVNDVDRRAEKNKNNPNYEKIDKEVVDILKKYDFFFGMTSFEAMAMISHEIEKRFAVLISRKAGTQIDSLDIPEFIDTKIYSIV